MKIPRRQEFEPADFAMGTQHKKRLRRRHMLDRIAGTGRFGE
jgi:hypothetical protein